MSYDLARLWRYLSRIVVTRLTSFQPCWIIFMAPRTTTECACIGIPLKSLLIIPSLLDLQSKVLENFLLKVATDSLHLRLSSYEGTQQRGWLIDLRGTWGADHTEQFRHHPSASPAVIVRKVAGHHLFLNIIPSNFTARTERKVWCDRGMRGNNLPIAWQGYGFLFRLTVCTRNNVCSTFLNPKLPITSSHWDDDETTIRPLVIQKTRSSPAAAYTLIISCWNLLITLKLSHPVLADMIWRLYEGWGLTIPS